MEKGIHNDWAAASTMDGNKLRPETSRTLLHSKKKAKRTYTTAAVFIGVVLLGGALAMVSVSAETGAKKSALDARRMATTQFMTALGSSSAATRGEESSKQEASSQAEASAGAELPAVNDASKALSPADRATDEGSKLSSSANATPRSNPKSAEGDKVNKDAAPSGSPSPGKTVETKTIENKTNEMKEKNGEKTFAASPTTTSSKSQLPSTDIAKSDKAIQLPTSYTVKSGDTLFSLSVQFYRSPQYVALIADHNRIKKTSELKVGDKLVIPSIPVEKEAVQRDYDFMVNDHTVKKGETLTSISLQYYQSPKHSAFLASFNHLDEKDSLKEGSTLKIPLSLVIDYD